MRFIVFSDTHGKIEQAEDVLDYFGDSADGFIHLGDYAEDAKRLHREFYNKICYSVKGNCDFGRGRDFIAAKIMGHGIYMCHGHREGVRHSVNSLYYSALENNCGMALFGHTHCKYYEDLDGVVLCNPGSTALPRDGSIGSFAVLDIDEKSTDINIYGIYGNEYKIIERSKCNGYY